MKLNLSRFGKANKKKEIPPSGRKRTEIKNKTPKKQNQNQILKLDFLINAFSEHN